MLVAAFTNDRRRPRAVSSVCGLVAASILAGLCALVAISGCGEDASAPDGGSPGGANGASKVSMLVHDAGVLVEVRFDGAGPFLLRYDTGSPTTYLDRDAATNAGLSEGGLMTAELGAFEVGQRPVTFYDWPEADYTYPGLPGPILGLVGNDFFAGYAVGLDYRERQLWVSDAADEDALLPRPDGTGDAVVVPFEDERGYLAVNCSFGDRTSNDCLFDTGAVHSLALASEWSKLAHPAPEQVPQLTVNNQGNLLSGFYQRASEVRSGDFVNRGDYVSVLDKFGLLSQVGASIQRNLVGLVGLETTLPYHTVIDYANSRLVLFPFDSLDHLPPSPFLGHGMIFTTSTADGLPVRAVAPLSRAAAAGIQVGDVLVAMDGLPLQQANPRFTSVGILADPIGQERRFQLTRGGTSYEAQVAAEDLLPGIY